MGLFDFLKPKRNNDRPATPQTVSMTQPQAERVCNDFGKFLAERQPIIQDASLLPHPKARIMAALEMQEQHVCDIANSYVRSGKDLAPKEIVKYLESLGGCRAILCYYSDIEAEDRNAVTHFNSFRSLRDVPPEEKADCVHLVCKCGSRGMEAEVPGYTASVNSLAEKMKQKEEKGD